VNVWKKKRPRPLETRGKQKAAATNAVRWLLMCAIFLSGPAIGQQIKPPTQDDLDFRKEVYVNKQKEELPSRLFVPLGYDREKKYPLLVWLHAGDGRGSDNLRQLTRSNQLPTHFWISKSVQADSPLFVLLPQCASGENWAEPELNQPGKALLMTMVVLKKLRSDYPIDPDRIYVGGEGMGGIGVWSLLQKYPEMWAGAVIISAYDNFTDAPAIAGVPLWVFQGDADDSVPVTMVRDMMRQLKKAGANVRYTEYHNVGREAGVKAFAEPDLARWLFAQRRNGNAGTSGQVGSGTTPVNP
jgi:predicted peptidase